MKCPNCKSTNVTQVAVQWFHGYDNYVCHSCKFQWMKKFNEQVMQKEYFLRHYLEEWYDTCIREFGEDKDMIETRLIEIIDHVTDGKVELCR